MVSLTPEGITLAVHVGAGVVALLAGAVAMVTEKGGDRHVRAGRVYVYAMAVVVLTVAPLLAFDPGDFARQFLLLVAIFSGYLVFSGYRVLARKRPGADSPPLDYAVAGLAALAGLALVGWGGYLLASGGDTLFGNIGVVMVVFGAISGGFGASDLLAFRNPERRNPWMATHLSRMVGGYIATVTAASVVNVSAVVPDPVAWLWPTAVGVPLIFYWLREYTGTGPLARAAD